MPHIAAPRPPVTDARESTGPEKTGIITRNPSAFSGETAAVKDVTVRIPSRR